MPVPPLVHPLVQGLILALVIGIVAGLRAMMAPAAAAWAASRGALPLQGTWLALLGPLLGVIGAVIGTYGGAGLRARLAVGFGTDRPAALLEDGVAVGGAVPVVVFA